MKILIRLEKNKTKFELSDAACKLINFFENNELSLGLCYDFSAWIA